MLNILKKAYEVLPMPLSQSLIRLFNLSYINSEKAWNNVMELEEEIFPLLFNEKEYLRFLEKQIDKLNKWVSKVSYYSSYGQITLNNLKKLKFIDSCEIKKHFKDFVNTRIKGYYTSTGGSGRSPTPLYLSDESYKLDYNHVLWSWWKNGYKKGCRKLTLRGVDLGNKLFKYNPIYNELIINIFKIGENNIEKIYKEILEFNPVFGHGYPSAFVRFINLLEKRNLRFSLKGISFVSENFNEFQRKKIEKYFKCKVTSFYGHSERAAFASEIDDNGRYYVLPSYGLIEVICEDGKTCKEGSFGEIVATTFINKGMPLVRYKTGDYCKLVRQINGFAVEIENINGRWGNDYIIDNKGRKIPMTAVNIHSLSQYHFKFIQFFQREKGVIIIKLVPFDYKDKKIEKYSKEIFKDFNQKLREFVIKVEIVKENDIYISKRGKVPYLVQEIRDN